MNTATTTETKDQGPGTRDHGLETKDQGPGTKSGSFFDLDLCPCCGGEGFLYFQADDGDLTSRSFGRCPECRGTGEVFQPKREQP